MTEQDIGKKEVEATPFNPWYADYAFVLGKTARNVTRAVKITVNIVDETCHKAKESFNDGFNQTKGLKVRRLRTEPETPQEKISPILKEMKAIADISGLTSTFNEMKAISLRQSSDPVISRLISKMEQLSPAEQEILSKKILERLSINPYFNNATRAIPFDINITEETCQEVSDTFLQCISFALKDMNIITEQEERLLQKINDDMSQPLHNLLQFYINPKTFPQKLKRLWKMQRVFFKTIKLIKKTTSLAAEMEGSQNSSYNDVQESPQIPQIPRIPDDSGDTDFGGTRLDLN